MSKEKPASPCDLGSLGNVASWVSKGSEMIESTTAYFTARAQADPATLARLLNLFTQLNMIPEQVRCTRRDDQLTVSVQVAGLGEHRAEIIAEKMRASVLVQSVTLEHRVERSQLAA